MKHFEGIIYGYPRPNGSICYVGQVQSLNLGKRHKNHLTDNLGIDKYLRSLEAPPEPIELMRIVNVARKDLIDDLSYWETVLMFKHHTLITWFPNDGGFNRSIPQSTDHSVLGSIGGPIGGRTNAINKTGVCGRSPEKMSADGRKYGRIGGRACVKNKTGLFGMTAEQKIAACRKGGFIAGPIAGRKAVECGRIQALGHRMAEINRKNNTGIFAPGMAAKGGKIQGPIQGRKNRENGQMAALGKKYGDVYGRIQGPITGRHNVESGHLARICTFETRAKGGRKSGRQNVENGQLARLRTPEHQAAAGHIGGSISIRKHKENGTGLFAPGIAASRGAKGGHLRWHVSRGIIKSTCPLCCSAK